MAMRLRLGLSALTLLLLTTLAGAQSPGYELLPWTLVDGRAVTLIDFHAQTPMTWRVRLIVNPDSCDVRFKHGTGPEEGLVFKGQQAIVVDKGDLSILCDPPHAVPAPLPPAPPPAPVVLKGGGVAIIEWLTRPPQ